MTHILICYSWLAARCDQRKSVDMTTYLWQKVSDVRRAETRKALLHVMDLLDLPRGRRMKGKIALDVDTDIDSEYSVCRPRLRDRNRYILANIADSHF